MNDHLHPVFRDILNDAVLPAKSTDKCLCCGSEEWDQIESERGRERDGPFRRCYYCKSEWTFDSGA